MKFISIEWAALLARQKQDTTSAKPACMNMTMNQVISVHMMLMEIRLWPAVSATSIRVGLPASFAGTSVIVPVAAPLASGLGGAGAAGAAAAAGAPGAGASSAQRLPARPNSTQAMRAAATTSLDLNRKIMIHLLGTSGCAFVGRW